MFLHHISFIHFIFNYRNDNANDIVTLKTNNNCWQSLTYDSAILL